MSDEEREFPLKGEDGFEEKEGDNKGDEHQEYLTAEEGKKRKEDDTEEHHDYLTKHFPGFLHAIKMCAKETDMKCIDIGNLSLETTNLKAIFNLLPNSKIVEFNAENNDLRSGMPEFIKQLTRSNVKKLSLKNCELQVQDVLALMQALQNTQVTDFDLSCLSFAALYSKKSAKAFVGPLKKSHLTHLRLTASSLLGHSLGKSVLGKYLASHISQTFITHLWLEQTGFRQDTEALKDLFTNLPTTCVTELYLGCNEIEDDQLKPLCENLKQSKLEVLDLRSNKITDAGINLLSEALVGSKVRELVVAANKISGANNLRKHLKDTSINTLHLGGNKIENCEMFIPDFLKGASVTELQLDFCGLGDEIAQNILKCLKSSEVKKVILKGNRLELPTASEFVSIIKETKMTEVDLSENNFSAEALEVLGDSIKESKLKHFILRGELNKLQKSLPISALIDKTKCSALESLDIAFTNFENNCTLLATSLKSTTLTHLNLSSCCIRNGIADLAPALKHTAITHLNLSKNEIDDVGTEKLAEVLKETNIFQLDVSDNGISDVGAKALVLCVKSGPLYRLNLGQNKITSEGIEELAKMIKGTFITDLEVACNSGQKTLPLITVTWHNRLLAHKLVRFFKSVFPTGVGGGGTFHFDSKADDVSFSTFVEKSLLLYKSALKDPSAISALANDDDISFSRLQVAKLVEAFPAQFISFIGNKANIPLEQHIKFLERAEALGLSEIGKFFLRKLAGFIVGQKKGIFRPADCKLLEKHKDSFYNLELKPEENKKIVQFFTARQACCGLCGKTRSLTKTKCCDTWICEDEHKYVPMSFSKISCLRNHKKYTLCSLHHEGKHKGKWQDCKQCKEDHRIENYIDYATSDYNFEKLENAPKVTITCTVCGFKSQTLKDFGCQVEGHFFCGKAECQARTVLPGLPNSHFGVPLIVPLYKYTTDFSSVDIRSLKTKFENFPLGS